MALTHEEIELVLTSVNSSISDVQSGTDMDSVVTRLDSVIDLLSSRNTAYDVLNILEEARILLLNVLEEQCHHPRTPGRPSVTLSMSNVEYLLNMKFSATKISEMLGTSRRTLYRRMDSWGFTVRSTYTDISDGELRRLILEILVSFPSSGYKRMKGYLLSRGVKVTDIRVRLLMKEVDPVGVYQRTQQNRAIVRRVYFVQYSNQLWHLDTNLKLVRWGFVIRGCIDGKSRTAIYLNASTDNRADTNLGSFLQGVAEFGVPLRTRSDKGGENVLVARYMIERRGTGRGSHICGKSVHNQRIERFWRDVSYGISNTYYNVFNWMENNSVLSIDVSKHISVLHMVFLPRLNRSLSVFQSAWNHHPISTERNFTPMQLMLMHLPPSCMDIHVNQEDLETADFLCNNHNDISQFHPDDSITNPVYPEANFSEDERRRLAEIDFLQDSDTFGCDIFRNALGCLDP